MPNTNFQTFHQMGNAINNVVKQATGRDNVQNIDMDFVTVAQHKRLVEEIITGNPASFVTNISEPIDHLIVQIDAVQSGSGDPSPENVRPISGWDSANVSRTGKNLIDVSSNVTDYALNASGVPTSLNGWNYSQLIPVNANQSYTFSFVNTDSITNSWSRRVHAYDTNGNWINQIATISTTPNVNQRYGVSFTVPSGIKYVRVSYPAQYSTEIQIESGSITETTYSPYTGAVYPITLPQTVYGGTVKVNKDGSGELVVDRADVDLGTLAYWSKDTNRPGVFYSGASANTRKVNSECVCSVYKWRSEEVPSAGSLPSADNSISLYPSYGSGYIYIVDIAKAELTAEQFKTAMSGVHLVYKLATPVTYQLTNQQVLSLLKGVNNIWADTGNVTVLYKNYEEAI